jgi:hypothetical protein
MQLSKLTYQAQAVLPVALSAYLPELEDLPYSNPTHPASHAGW